MAMTMWHDSPLNSSAPNRARGLGWNSMLWIYTADRCVFPGWQLLVIRKGSICLGRSSHGNSPRFFCCSFTWANLYRQQKNKKTLVFSHLLLVSSSLRFRKITIGLSLWGNAAYVWQRIFKLLHGWVEHWAHGDVINPAHVSGGAVLLLFLLHLLLLHTLVHLQLCRQHWLFAP